MVSREQLGSIELNFAAFRCDPGVSGVLGSKKCSKIGFFGSNLAEF